MMRQTARSFVVALTSVSVACGPSSCGSTRVPSSTTDVAARVDQIGTPVQDSTRALAELLVGSRTGVNVSTADTLARLDRLFGLVKAADAVVPRDTFDVEAVVSQAGRDPGTLAAWVRDHITLVPYRGTLRGPVGVLMDRMGNSLDRSLLLARLLRSAGTTARLARGQLTPAVAATLWKQATATRSSGAPPWTTPDGPFIDDYAAQSGQNAQAIREGLRQVAAASDRVSEQVKTRVAAQTASLAKMVGFAPSDGDGGAQAVEALRDHWWVQWQDGATWTDLDPSVVSPDQSLVPPQETMAPDRVADDLHHDVEVRVMVERWNGTGFSEARVLSHRLRPSETLGQRIELRQIPMNWPRDAKAVLDSNGLSGFKAAVLGEHEWRPTLTIGDRIVSQFSFTDTGDVNEKPGVNSRNSGPRGGFLDAFGGDPEPPPPAGILTAEWIEYEIRSPGAPSRVIRRDVFDVVDPALREARRPPSALTDAARWSRGLSLIGTTELLPIGSHVSEPFLVHMIGAQISSAAPVLKAIVANAGTLSGQAAMDAAGQLKPLSVRLYELAAARSRWSRSPRAVYVARPNVLARHSLAVPDQNGGFQMAEAFDIVANEVDILGTGPVMARLEQGVLDSNAEAALIGPAANGGSTADVFGLDGSSGGWTTVRTAADVKGLGLRPELATRIARDVSAGYVVVAPKADGAAGPNTEAGWWRIDPRTGDTLAIGSRGWGQSMVEYSATKLLLINVALSLGCMALIGSFNPNGLSMRMAIVCTLTAGSFVFSGMGAGLQAAIFGIMAVGIWGNDNAALSRRVF